jgi:hypothetical protein
MKNKKDVERFVPRVDESLPSKAAADPRRQADEAPAYEGERKTDQPPAQRSGKPRTKEDIEPRVTRKPRNAQEMTELADMEPRHRRPAPAAGAEQPAEEYIRLRIRVRGDRMTVIDSHLVDGPLASTTAFPGNNAYEVTLDDRLLHAGALPDFGTQRSFVAPNPAPGEDAHHFTERDVFEFSARVPAADVTPETIGAVTVRLHRVKGEARAARLTDQPLAVQFEQEMRPVAELVGLPQQALPEEIAARGARTPRA